MKKVAKPLLIVVAVYVGIVGAFETLLGLSQPTSEGTMVITTFDDEGTGHDRVVSRLELDDRLYVAVNHWPRAWYGRVLENPRVDVTYDGETARHVAVGPSEEEREAVESAHPVGLVFRALTGFPPRRVVRLDPE